MASFGYIFMLHILSMTIPLILLNSIVLFGISHLSKFEERRYITALKAATAIGIAMYIIDLAALFIDGAGRTGPHSLSISFSYLRSLSHNLVTGSLMIGLLVVINYLAVKIFYKQGLKKTISIAAISTIAVLVIGALRTSILLYIWYYGI